MLQDRTGQDRTGQDRTGQDRTAQCSAAQDTPNMMFSSSTCCMCWARLMMWPRGRSLKQPTAVRRKSTSPFFSSIMFGSRIPRKSCLQTMPTMSQAVSVVNANLHCTECAPILGCSGRIYTCGRIGNDQMLVKRIAKATFSTLDLPQLKSKFSRWCVECTEVKLRKYSLMSCNKQKQQQPCRRTATMQALILHVFCPACQGCHSQDQCKCC